MSWKQILLPEVQQFIAKHADDNVHDLALKKPPDASWSYGLILDQIKVRQKSRIKSPDLYDTDSFIFPSNDTYEQASSSACAAYKASLARGNSFVDFTAGTGIDAYHISKNFSSGVLVERDSNSAELLKHNMAVLTKEDNTDLSIYHGDALEYAQNMGEDDFAFIDPQRREISSGANRKGIFDFSACSPDIISLMPFLKYKFKRVMIKASPVLDIEKAIGSLNDAAGVQAITQVHIVQWQGECKEVLYLIDFDAALNAENVIITAVQINNIGKVQYSFSYKAVDEKNLSLNYSMPLKYIYEPSAAFQKSGGFKSMAVQFDVKKLHLHSHLYTSDKIVENFPGKMYGVLDIISAKAKNIKINQADLTIRNFPDTVHNLKKKLKISDGGSHRIFATTLCNNKKKLIICAK